MIDLTKVTKRQIGICKIGGIHYIMWEELGISGGTAIIVLIALYYVVKWAVKNGIKQAYKDITGKKPNVKLAKELGLSDDEEHK